MNQAEKEQIIQQLHEVFANTESEAVATIMANTIDFINGVKRPQIWTNDGEL